MNSSLSHLRIHVHMNVQHLPKLSTLLQHIITYVCLPVRLVLFAGIKHVGQHEARRGDRDGRLGQGRDGGHHQT